VSERFEIGQRVTWLRSQPGAYRFDEPIAGIVREVTNASGSRSPCTAGSAGGRVSYAMCGQKGSGRGKGRARNSERFDVGAAEGGEPWTI
jgi:hypothetical protein